MAAIHIHMGRVLRNIEKLDKILRGETVSWTLAMKVLGSHKEAIRRLLESDLVRGLHSVGDSHLSGLEAVKSIAPDVTTMYIKPPALRYIKSVVRVADISLNSSFTTIEALNEEAARQGKVHKVIVMIEMGELREGILRDNIVEFYQHIFELPNINVIGLGTNLGCMYGLEPTYDKLIQLSLYKQLLEAKFNHKMELASGGSSITLPMLTQRKLPTGVNHFRIGEAAFLGTSPLDNKQFRDLSVNAFDFKANILELYKKESQPDGIVGEAAVGHTAVTDVEGESYKAILDFGILDVDPAHVQPKPRNVRFFGNSSDMTVFDLGKNRRHFKTGDVITFRPDYMAVAKLMNSKFIEKQFD